MECNNPLRIPTDGAALPQDEMCGVITNVQRFCVHDGPGIRTTVFFKGCPMRCIWCQNPETHLVRAELMHRKESCIGCGYCIRSCPNGAVFMRDGRIEIDRTRCKVCGKCAQTCYAGSMEIIGKQCTVESLMAELLRDEAFFRKSGGGVTLSGGEVMLQYRFAAQLLARLHERGIGTAIETAGYCDWEAFETVLPHTDLFLYDVKHLDDAVHRNYTGVSNRTIQDNLRRLSECGARLVIRVPLIPQVNDSVEHMTRVAELAVSLGAKELHILPFHQAGSSKWTALDKDYSCAQWSTHDSAYLETVRAAVEAKGIRTDLGGGGSLGLGEHNENGCNRQ